jgi:hypothetical protein
VRIEAPSRFEWRVRHLRSQPSACEDLCGLADSESDAIRLIQEHLVDAPHGSRPAGRICRVRLSLDGCERLGLVAYAIWDDASGLAIWTPVRRITAEPPR